MTPSISVVVNTLDEERRLGYALRSVQGWVDDIVVVDMASTDRTVEIARSFGARVFEHPRSGFVEPARAFACAQAPSDWILVLDADELVPPALGRTLRRIAAGDEADVVRIAFVNHLLGAPVLHSGWNPERDRHVRFWKNGAVTLPDEVHGAIAPRPGMRLLELPYEEGQAIVHLGHADVAAFLDKLNAYTSIEARQAFARGVRPSVARALRAAIREWLARYVRHGGVRDGWRGFYLSLLMAGYRIATEAKLAEHAEVGSREDAERRYARVAERLLAAYAAGAAPPQDAAHSSGAPADDPAEDGGES